MTNKRLFGFGEFSTWVKKQLADLLSLVDAKLGKSEKAASSSDSDKLGGQEPTHYATAEAMSQLEADVNRTAANLQGDRGQILFVKERNTPGSFEAGEIFNKSLAIALNATEVTQSKVVKESFAEAFNQWTRISHNGAGAQPAIVSELEAWSYDEANDRILSTTNSSSLIGFISPESFDEYVFEVTCSSTNPDDDYIGLSLAAVEHEGKLHQIYALFYVGSDTKANSKLIIQAGPGFMTTTNGMAYHITEVDFGLMTDQFGTDGWVAIPNGWRIKVVRKGDSFTLTSSQPGQTALDPSTTITFNLNDAPELAKYKGSGRFGYLVQSQANATWKTHRRPGSSTPVYDVSTKQLWSVNEAGDWVAESDVAMNTVLKPGRFYYNENQKSLYYVNKDGGVTKVVMA